MTDFYFWHTDEGMKVYSSFEVREIIKRDGLEIVTKHSRWLLKGDKAVWTAFNLLSKAVRTPIIREKSDRFMSITFLRCDEKSLFLV